MAVKTYRPSDIVTHPARSDYDMLMGSFRRSLLAQNMAPTSIQSYIDSVNFLGDYLLSQGMPLTPAGIHREHVESYLAHIMSTPSPKTGKPIAPASALTRYRTLRVFFNWLIEMDEIKDHPMEHMKPPRLVQKPPPVLTDDQLRKLIKTCEGKDFDSRRDMALIRLFIDTGVRRSELAGLKLEDVDLDRRLIHVMGKGRKARSIPFGAKTAKALDIYINFSRKHHSHSALPVLWLSQRGALTAAGIGEVVKRLATEAGIGNVHPHLFRHGFAHSWLVGGGQEQDLMVLAGWQSRTMLGRYGASAATERAREAYKRLSPGDRL